MGYIVVVDYDMGNFYFVCKGLEKVGGNFLVMDQVYVIDGVMVIVLLGVGFFDLVVQYLWVRGLEEVFKMAIVKGIFFLGICLGF